MKGDILGEGHVVFVRGLIAFVSLIIYAHILGKQQISQLTFFNYVLGITIGSTASTLTTDLSSRAWPHWVGLTMWFAAVHILQWVSLKWRRAYKYIDGESVVLIMNVKIMENAMRKTRLRLSDILVSIEMDEANRIENNLARIKGYTAAKDKAGALAELAEAINLWNELGK